MLLVYLGLNAGFVATVVMTYFFVSRRRAKIYLLVEHLASLVRKGMPIHMGLRMMGQDLGGYFGTRVERAARRIEEGSTLGEAFRAAPGTFPPLLRGMVDLGERSGNLGGFLEEMRRSYRRVAELPYQSVYFFIYPVFLSVCVNLALTLFYGFIVPRMQEVMLQVKVLAPYYRWFPALALANQVVLVICILFVLFIFTGGTSIHFASSILRFMKSVLDRVVLWIPVLGGLVRDSSIHAFSLAVALFLRAGATLPAAVKAAASAERNAVLRHRYEKLVESLEEGARLSECGRKERAFPDDFLWFVEAGEASGALPDHLLQAAVHYDTKVRFAARLALRGVIPAFVLLNGAMVLATCLMVYLPLRDIIKSIGPW